MKKTILFFINIYQVIFSALIKNMLGITRSCRYTPTCSDYAKMAVSKHGVLAGSMLAFRRIISCQPIDFKQQKSKIKLYIQRVGII